jgi:hypothetical protein
MDTAAADRPRRVDQKEKRTHVPERLEPGGRKSDMGNDLPFARPRESRRDTWKGNEPEHAAKLDLPAKMVAVDVDS